MLPRGSYRGRWRRGRARAAAGLRVPRRQVQPRAVAKRREDDQQNRSRYVQAVR